MAGMLCGLAYPALVGAYTLVLMTWIQFADTFEKDSQRGKMTSKITLSPTKMKFFTFMIVSEWIFSLAADALFAGGTGPLLLGKVVSSCLLFF